MAGAIIEKMSTKMLVLMGVILLLFQAFAFMAGGLIAPSPTTAVNYVATKCVDTAKHRQESKWFMPWGPNQCYKIQSFEEAPPKMIEANNIVFAVHIPPPNKEMSPWFQFMLVILQFDIAFKMYNQIEAASADKEAAERFPQVLKEIIDEGGYSAKQIFNGIHQNGGFTKVWFAMKTFLTPSILIIMIWYWRRITLMTRPPVLLEKVIFALGISMTFINIPVEWFSIGFNWTWMLLFGDIRQGIFYSMLLSFWIIFCGEHLMDQTERNRFSVYWKQVGPIVFGSFCLFIFDMCERGVQLTNPFYSIWASDVGTELAMAFIIVAGICACLYFLFLCFMVFQVFRNISGKRTSLPAMSKARRLHYEGLIFRFKFLMLVTLACAAMTVIFFIISQVNEGHWHWGDHTVQVNSAFFTGIYGMWNLYVFAIMFLYAPSHKRYGDDQSSGQCITARAYLDSDLSGRKGLPIITIKRGAEPPIFTGWFHAWDPKIWETDPWTELQAPKFLPTLHLFSTSCHFGNSLLMLATLASKPFCRDLRKDENANIVCVSAPKHNYIAPELRKTTLNYPLGPLTCWEKKQR
ncbi:protein wntless homolog [Vanacampus margaritifer]